MKYKEYSTEDVKKAVQTSYSYAEVLRKLDYVATAGGNYNTIRKIIKENKMDISHFKGSGWSRGYIGDLSKSYVPLEKLLINNSVYHSNIKYKLKNSGLIPYICDICKNGPEWNGKELKLQIDHKNGNKFDNRIENLRFICPNCHTQTPTFCRKNKNGQVAQSVEAQRLERCKCESESRLGYQTCKMCFKKFSGREGQKYCSYTCSSRGQRKAVRPSKEELEYLLKTETWTALSKKYGVSDKAVRKWAIKYGIELRRRGETENALVLKAGGETLESANLSACTNVLEVIFPDTVI